jgi:uncharacterized protein (DUF924 family)
MAATSGSIHFGNIQVFVKPKTTGVCVMSLHPQAVVDFWYSDRVRPLWFNSTPEFDEELRQTYGQLYSDASEGRLREWENTAIGALALAIILDQFPLNMFRGRPESFATESEAVRIVHDAVAKGFDVQLEKENRIFLYMPLMHSENLADQDLSVQLFSAAGLTNNLRFAKHHREIVRRFGRFPHRNAILGRQSTPEEQTYLASDEAFHG